MTSCARARYNLFLISSLTGVCGRLMCPIVWPDGACRWKKVLALPMARWARPHGELMDDERKICRFRLPGPPGGEGAHRLIDRSVFRWWIGESMRRAGAVQPPPSFTAFTGSVMGSLNGVCNYWCVCFSTRACGRHSSRATGMIPWQAK